MSGCWICGGETGPCARFAPEPFLECSSCHFAFRPDLDSEALQEVYRDGAYEEIRGTQYLELLADRRRDARVRLGYLRPWATGGRLLDVGAAGGAFVAEASAGGFRASGIEPVPSFARLARDELGADVITGSLGQVELDPDGYDVISMWHVLEHIPRPVGALRTLEGALHDGGVLAVEVPNAGSEMAARLGPDWGSLEAGVHVCQFGPQSLRLALEGAGLEVLDLRTIPITPYLTRAARLDPRHLASRLKAALWLRDPRGVHPDGHELLRAVARRRSSAERAAQGRDGAGGDPLSA